MDFITVLRGSDIIEKAIIQIYVKTTSHHNTDSQSVIALRDVAMCKMSDFTVLTTNRKALHWSYFSTCWDKNSLYSRLGAEIEAPCFNLNTSVALWSIVTTL